MMLEFYLDDVIVFNTKSDCVPPPGAEVRFAMETTVSGYVQGWNIRAKVRDDKSPRYAFADGPTVAMDIEVVDFSMSRDE